MKRILVACAVAISMPAMCSAQDSKPIPFESKLVGALFDRQVQGELELIEDQKEELKAILGSLQARQKELAGQLKEFQDDGASQAELESRRADLVLTFEKDKSSTMTEAMKVLLPHQQKRLRQTAVQLWMRQSAKSNRVPTGVLSPEIRAYLKIDDAQAKRISQKATEIQKTLAEKIRKLTEQAQAELMGELTETQRSEYAELIGDPLKVDGSKTRQ